MHGRYDRTAASLSFHAHIVDHFSSTDRARRRVLKKATGGTRAVWLRREAATLRVVHALLDRFGIVWFETQRRAQQQLAFAKRSVTIVPLDTAAGNLNHLAFARDAHRFRYRADLVTVRAGVHPQRAADSARNSAESFNARQARARHVDAESRQ